MLIKGGRIIDPASGLDAVGDVLIQDGLIKQVFKGDSGKTDPETIDARGLIVTPGFIDLHVHLREPGQEYKEDIASGTAAAAAGGVTTVVCMANTDPVNDNASTTRYIIEKAAKVSPIRVLPVGAVTKGLKGVELAEMGLMKAAGIVAVSDDGACVQDSGVFRRGLEYAGDLGLVTLTHCQDKGLHAGGAMNESELCSRLGLPGSPAAAEEVMLARDVLVASETGCPVHIGHVSTARGLAIIRQAKAQGAPVSCEATPHHLLLTEQATATYDTNAKMYPPLRREADRLALIEGLRDGTIDAIATDHAPHAYDEKNRDFESAPNGMIGLQALLPSVITLHRDYGLDLSHLIACLTCRPAKLLNLPTGTLAAGAPADLAIFDPSASWTYDASTILSKSKNTPLLGQQLTGKVRYTVCGGRVVYKD